MNSIEADLYRLTCRTDKRVLIYTILNNKSFRHLYFYRKCKENHSRLLNLFFRIAFHFAYKKSGIELPLSAELGKGALFIHVSGITLNKNTITGDNLTMLKGATVGVIKGGEKAGTPIIGNNVYIGLNSTVVGKIRIGNDVLIAANTFVNFDVPDHSVVIGSPGVIHKKTEATKDYIVNAIQ